LPEHEAGVRWTPFDGKAHRLSRVLLLLASREAACQAPG
jgi:hypothetical protein